MVRILIVSNGRNEFFMRIVYFDTETTGVNPRKDRIIELALYIVEDGKVVDKYDKFINIGSKLPSEIVELTGISDDMLRFEGVSERVVAEDLLSRLSPRVLMVAHNCQFDLNFIYELLCRYYKKASIDKLFKRMYWLDTLTVFKDRKPYPHKLVDLVEYYDLGEFQFHRAIDDTRVLPLALGKMVRERNDVREYVNVFGFNKRYGVSGRRFPFIRYVKQDFHDRMVRSKEILPYCK